MEINTLDMLEMLQISGLYIGLPVSPKKKPTQEWYRLFSGKIISWKMSGSAMYDHPKLSSSFFRRVQGKVVPSSQVVSLFFFSDDRVCYGRVTHGLQLAFSCSFNLIHVHSF